MKAVKGNTLPLYKGEDYTGRLFGSWKVLGPITCERVNNTQNYKTKWLCQCACGSEPKWTVKENLIMGRTKGCTDCVGTRTNQDSNSNWKGFGEISGQAFNKVRCGASARDISLEVTLEELNSLWLQQDRKCALTGLPLIMGDTASLDRIDSKAAYVTGNVQWVHKHINKMKNDFPEDVFVSMCAAVSSHKACN